MRVVSWNIELGKNYKLAAEELATIDKLRGADIILLQEMDEEGCAAIARKLGANYAYNSSVKHPKTGRDFGNAILSPWPLSNANVLPLPHEARIRGVPRAACRARVGLDGLAINAYSVHAEIATMKLSKRVEQFITVAEHAMDTSDVQAGDPVVVGGDFNTMTVRGVSALVETMAAAQLQHASARSGPSFRFARQNLRLDHVFSANLTTIATGVANEATASDHLPVWLDMRSPTKSGAQETPLESKGA